MAMKKDKLKRRRYIIQGDYGKGMEDETNATDLDEALDDLKAYNKNDPKHQHQIKIVDEDADEEE